MGEQIRITSVELLDTFRQAVLDFRTSALQGLSGVSHDIRRMQQWIDHEQPMVWRQRLRRARAAVDNARNDLERAKLSRPDDHARMFFEQRRALERAQDHQRKAEERLDLLKRASRKLEHQATLTRAAVQPLVSILDADLELLVARLQALAKHLDAYLRLPAPPTDFDAWAMEMGETINPFARSGDADDSEGDVEETDA